MKTATVRDLRNNFSKLEAWLADGEEICVEKRGQPIGYLSSKPRGEKKVVVMPDFRARVKKIWGDRVFSEEEVREMREFELEGEEG
jgi:antitoxin (DNA-binding transcriptional repressor) of toxin-antitoxin stability system